MERLFLALWPDQEVSARLANACADLALKGGRLIAPRNLHVTLIFLGDTEAARRACIEQAVSSVRAGAFQAVLTEVEWRRKTGIVWATAPEVPAALLDLVAQLRAALAACLQPRDPRPYRWHVTLARDVRHGPRRQAIAPIVWRAGEVCLVSSKLTPAGSEYTVERRWPLH